MQFQSDTALPSRLHVLIPALNEAENLPALFAEVVPALERTGKLWHLLFVDDGSSDETVVRIRAMGEGLPVEVVSHPANLGPGAAFTTGFRRILETADDADAVLTLEADTTSDITLLPVMLAKLEQGADCVLASVYHPEGRLLHTHTHRRALSRVANILVQKGLGIDGLYTFSSFYRIYRVKVLREAFDLYGQQLLSEPGFASVVELLIRLHRMGTLIEEVPMTLDSTRRRGSSRMKVWRTIRAYLRLMARLRLERPPTRA